MAKETTKKEWQKSAKDGGWVRVWCHLQDTTSSLQSGKHSKYGDLHMTTQKEALK